MIRLINSHVPRMSTIEELKQTLVDLEREEPTIRLVVVRTPMTPRRIEARARAMEVILSKILRD